MRADHALPISSRRSHDHVVKSIEKDYSDREDNEGSLSGSAQHSSGPDEAVFDDNIDMTGNSSPRTSQHSDDEISEFPADSPVPSCTIEPQSSSPYTPFKSRSPFRNPSSVRALQMETTPPPYLTPTSPKPRYKFETPSRNGTPHSTRSNHSTTRSTSKLSPAKKVKKEYPLVLLHVTLLPISCAYSQNIMESVLPGYMIENWKILREKATDTVLERGILIPHPKEDYDLLEERLLESLELKMPRILKCGHFHTSVEESEDIMGSDVEEFDSDEDADICDDCGRRIRDGRLGSGTGSRRWEIRIYAANGLMRAGAWGAAWREMERVDVEILPWIADDMRRELDLRRDEDERHAPEPFGEDLEDMPRSTRKSGSTADERLKEIYGEDAPAYVDGLMEEPPQMDESWREPHAQMSKRKRHQESQDVPIWNLLRNYIYLAAQDRRNVAILLLGILVLFLSFPVQSRSTSSLIPPSKIPTAVAKIADRSTDTMLQVSSSSISAISSSQSSPSSAITLSSTGDLPPASSSPPSVMAPLSSMIASLAEGDDLPLE